ncbi:MAG TPA: hypothetical protein VFX12_05230 [Vicinamibacterales bacterium]|nr:hypothetical protein [Vicinamibacterales bacterium]
MTGAGSALRDGVRRVARAPVLLFGTFFTTLLIAIPLAIALDGMLKAQLGTSGIATALARGADEGWWQEFLAQAHGLGTTFVPSIIGFGAVLQDVSDLLDDVRMATTIAGVTAAWLVVWSFLSGGLLDRYARNRAIRARGFFGACGAHFGPIVRLGLLALVAYGILFGWVHGWIAGEYGRLTRNLTVERSAFLVYGAALAVFGLLLIVVNVVVDYARIRIVVEDRRSAVGGLLAGFRFVRRQPGTVAALYGLNAALFIVLIAIYGLAAPGAGTAGAIVWLAFGLSEAYLLARHFLKLTFYASETALFQARLAHAAYTAAPPVLWPESPAAESIGNTSP